MNSNESHSNSSVGKVSSESDIKMNENIISRTLADSEVDSPVIMTPVKTKKKKSRPPLK